MPKSNPLHCSDELYQSLVEASHCAFILLAMYNKEEPIDVYDVADLLRVDILAADDIVSNLLRKGYILPLGKSSRYVITQSGIDLLSPDPKSDQKNFDPDDSNTGFRLPSYIAFDLLPLRILAFRSKLDLDDRKN